MIVRTDLPAEQQTVQSIHAAFEAGRFAGERNLNLVVCAVPDEATLQRYAARLRDAELHFILFHEPDLADAFPGAAEEGVPTALATQPVGREHRRLFANLPLWRPAWLKQ